MLGVHVVTLELLSDINANKMSFKSGLVTHTKHKLTGSQEHERNSEEKQVVQYKLKLTCV